jgi:hypothetical protein
MKEIVILIENPNKSNHRVLWIDLEEMTSDVPVPKITGDDAPEGFNKNEVLVYKGYFCKYMCQKEWDNFSEEKVFLNDELRDNARALYNQESEKAFVEEIFESETNYQQMTRFVVNSLVDIGLLEKEEKPGEIIYWRTSKLKDLCPMILSYDLPVIDALVIDYDKSRDSVTS